MIIKEIVFEILVASHLILFVQSRMKRIKL